MFASSAPPGWSHNPSTIQARLPLLVLAFVGFVIATYLGLYQLGIVAAVWEPFFGDGSRTILKESSVARFLPIPDALLGAGAYLAEFVVNVCGGAFRWRTAPWLVVLAGLIALCLGLTGIGLAVAQPLLFHAFCTLCLASAACSIVITGLAMSEAWATLRFLRRACNNGTSPWLALWGRETQA